MTQRRTLTNRLRGIRPTLPSGNGESPASRGGTPLSREDPRGPVDEAAHTERATQLSTWKHLRPLAEDKKGALAGLAVAAVLSGLAESGILAILAQSAAALANGTSKVSANLGPLSIDKGLGVLLAVGFVLALGRLGLQAVASIVPAHIAATMQARLRTEVFAAFTQASWSVQSRDREGHLQELLTNQVAQATSGVLQSTQLVIALLTFLMLVVSALAFNALAALIVLLAAGVLSAALRPLSSLGRRHARATSRASIGYAGGVNEAVRLAEEAQVFGVGAAQREQAADLATAVESSFYRTQLLSRLVPGVYQSTIYLLVLAALAGIYTTTGGTQIASLGAVVLLLVRAGTYGQQAQSAYQSLRQTLPYLDRLRQAEERYAASTPAPGELPLEEVRILTFEKVCFAYEPGQPALSDVDFAIAGGEAIGIVGPSGAGKSTLVQILLRLRMPDSGSYRINGVPIDRFNRGDWHRKVAYVPQEPRLLHASVADNIRFTRNLDEDAVERAARLAGIHDEIETWPQGYATMVGPRADAVSGGQQQRICLARALAAEPEVLVLDEPTSALDPHSEHLIQKSLYGLKHKLTLFVVAHRMSTLDICERVMVVVNGRLEAFDTADRLRLGNAYYRSASELTAGPSFAADPDRSPGDGQNG
jgi:ATP-binding cassette subfamily B protein